MSISEEIQHSHLNCHRLCMRKSVTGKMVQVRQLPFLLMITHSSDDVLRSFILTQLAHHSLFLNYLSSILLLCSLGCRANFTQKVRRDTGRHANSCTLHYTFQIKIRLRLPLLTVIALTKFTSHAKSIWEFFFHLSTSFGILQSKNKQETTKMTLQRYTSDKWKSMLACGASPPPLKNSLAAQHACTPHN